MTKRISIRFKRAGVGCRDIYIDHRLVGSIVRVSMFVRGLGWNAEWNKNLKVEMPTKFDTLDEARVAIREIVKGCTRDDFRRIN